MADFPSVPFTALNLNSNTPTVVTKSLSGLEQRNQVSTQYFNFTADFNNISDAERRQIIGFLMSKRGSLLPFTIDLPEPFQDSSGTLNLIINVTASTAGSTAVTIQFSSVVAGTVLKAGDFVKFSGHNKVYMVTDDVSANTSGLQSRTLNIFPALRQTATSNSVTHKNVPMYVKCTTDQFGFNSDPNLYSSFSLDFTEVIQ